MGLEICVACACVKFFIVSVVCIMKSLGFGWALFREAGGNSGVIIAGIVVVAIPLFSVVASIIVS